jgi:hypothetical protein
MAFYKAEKENVEMIEALKKLTRLKYGRERALVEQEINNRYKI